MNLTETRQLMHLRRQLVGQVYDDDTIDAWHEALAGHTYADCQRAMLTACKENKRVTVAHIYDNLPHDTATPVYRPERLCIRCQLVEAEPLKTRCVTCQAFVDDEVALGIHNPAMMDAIAAANRLRKPGNGN